MEKYLILLTLTILCVCVVCLLGYKQNSLAKTLRGETLEESV